MTKIVFCSKMTVLQEVTRNKESCPQTPPKNYRCFHVTLKGLVQQIVFMFGTCIYKQLYFIEWYMQYCAY